MMEGPWRFLVTGSEGFIGRSLIARLAGSGAEVFSLTVPGKIQACMASGKPVIAALDGEGARTVNEARAGWTCGAGDADALASIVLEAYSLTPVERQRIGERGREYCHAHFDRDAQFAKLERILIEAARAAKKET